MKVYLDNVATSGQVLEDLVPEDEMQAVRSLGAAAKSGELELVTSRESWREQERTRNAAKRAKLKAARNQTPTVELDHVLRGYNTVYDYLGGFVTSLLLTEIVDEPLFSDLKAIGLNAADARHLMYAATNECVRFVTLDSDFITRRTSLESRCPIVRIVRPTELWQELKPGATLCSAS